MREGEVGGGGHPSIGGKVGVFRHCAAGKAHLGEEKEPF